jgi:hypothetical protein
VPLNQPSEWRKDLISLSQTEFLPNKHITEGFLYASEVGNIATRQDKKAAL